MAVALENLRKDVLMRTDSDRQMPTWWLLVFCLPIIIGLVGAASIFVSLIDFISSIDPTAPYDIAYESFSTEFAATWMIAGLTGLVNVAVSIILMYLLVNRRYTHFKRQKFLSEDVIAAIGLLAQAKDVDVQVSLASLERTTREATAEEIDKSAILWSILSAFVPFVQLYVYYFLMNDFYRHERREDGFFEDASRALNKLGVTFSVPRRSEAVPNRSFVLYLILTIVTVGMFGVYWVYVLLKDPNEHFKYHVQVENQLITVLEPALT